MTQNRSIARFPIRGLDWRRALWQIEASVRQLSRKFIKRGGRPQRFCDPEDVEALGERADAAFRQVKDALPLGSRDRGRQILQFIEAGFPTPSLEAAYFTNLSAMLANASPLASRGELVIGLGTGRSGSTSLSALLGHVGNACSTHENPPLVFWSPRPEQVSFHLRRFAILTRYYALVSDCAHWWINLVDELVREFPNVKFIGVVRDRSACAVSFARIKGFGRGSYNHWVQHPNNLWRPAQWDPTYPKFEPPSWADAAPDRAKWHLIEKYIDLYNAKMIAVAERCQDRFLILRTECLDDPSTTEKVLKFLGIEPPIRAGLTKLNVRSTKDGHREIFRV